jgi:hypothetical protein
MCYSFSKTCDYDYEERLDRLNRLAARLIQETQDILDLQFGVIDASLLSKLEMPSR